MLTVKNAATVTYAGDDTDLVVFGPFLEPFVIDKIFLASSGTTTHQMQYQFFACSSPPISKADAQLGRNLIDGTGVLKLNCLDSGTSYFGFAETIPLTFIATPTERYLAIVSVTDDAVAPSLSFIISGQHGS